MNDGGDEYAKIGIGKSTGTKLISAGGNIKKPGVYEIELGITCEEFLNSEEWCGGVEGRVTACGMRGTVEGTRRARDLSVSRGLL